MARYIDVEPLEDKLKEHIRKTESELMLGALSTFKRLLDITPTADVAPVRHGRWKPFDRTWGRSVFACTACGDAMDVPTEMGNPIFAYCPNCGARMDAKE